MMNDRTARKALKLAQRVDKLAKYLFIMQRKLPENMAGTITAHGSDEYYTVELIGETDKDGDPLEVSVKQLQIADGVVIPNGTAVIVVAAAKKYYMQVPVYM